VDRGARTIARDRKGQERLEKAFVLQSVSGNREKTHVKRMTG